MLDKKVKMKMPMAKITRDLIAHMRDEDYLDRIITTKLAKDGNIHYDRGSFIKMYDDTEGYDSVYDREILQMVHYGYIIYKNDKGQLIRHADNYLTE